MRKIFLCTSFGSFFWLLSLHLLFIVLYSVPCHAERYVDMGNGTLRDEHLVKFWLKNDSYQDLKAWVDLKGAEAYAKQKNRERFGGYADWRLPLKSELKSLYSSRNKGLPTYDKSELLRVDGAFNISYCYLWTKEMVGSEFAWQVSLCNGRVYKGGKTNGPGNSALLIRP